MILLFFHSFGSSSSTFPASLKAHSGKRNDASDLDRKTFISAVLTGVGEMKVSDARPVAGTPAGAVSAGGKGAARGGPGAEKARSLEGCPAWRAAQ